MRNNLQMAEFNKYLTKNASGDTAELGHEAKITSWVKDQLEVRSGPTLAK